jgi:hypothetical protein
MFSIVVEVKVETEVAELTLTWFLVIFSIILKYFGRFQVFYFLIFSIIPSFQVLSFQILLIYFLLFFLTLLFIFCQGLFLSSKPFTKIFSDGLSIRLYLRSSLSELFSFVAPSVILIYQ